MCMGMYYLVKLGFLTSPPTVPLGIVHHFADKTSILATNVRGPPVAYHIGGKESIKVTTFMPNLGDIAGGFAIVSHQDIIWVSFTSDTNRCRDAKEIIQIFEETMDQILKS